MSENHGDLVARPPFHTASFERLDPDRFDEIFLYREIAEDTDQNHSCRTEYRYKLTVVDRPLDQSITCATAVFLIPAGRESEYLFCKKHGLQSIAKSALTARLIAVTFGRNHSFQSQQAVQDELTYVAQLLGLSKSQVSSYKHIKTVSIPFMALDGLGERNIVAQGETATSGRFIVEQCKTDIGYVRRLYFLDGNPFVIQSEVTLKDDVVDKSYTSFDYHKSLTAGILVSLPKSTANLNGLLIGLGGGGLVNLWHHLQVHLDLIAIELDKDIVDVASKYFALNTNKIDVRIGNGLSIRCTNQNDTTTSTPNPALEFAANSLDFIVLDVDSKDTSVGMSCPPVEFLETSYLQTLSLLLKDSSGILAINVSARDPAAFKAACDNLKSVFPQILLSQERSETDDQEDLNVVVFAFRSIERPKHATMSGLPQILENCDEVLLSDLLSRWENFKADDSAERAREEISTSKTHDAKKRSKKKGKKKR